MYVLHCILGLHRFNHNVLLINVPAVFGSQKCFQIYVALSVIIMKQKKTDQTSDTFASRGSFLTWQTASIWLVPRIDFSLICVYTAQWFILSQPGGFSQSVNRVIEIGFNRSFPPAIHHLVSLGDTIVLHRRFHDVNCSINTFPWWCKRSEFFVSSWRNKEMIYY